MGKGLRLGAAALATALVSLLLLTAAAGAGGGGGNNGGNNNDQKPPRPRTEAPSSTGLFKGSNGDNGQAAATARPWWQIGGVSQGKGAPGAGTASTLIVYDTTGAYGWLGELYAQYVANLASHFGSWKAQPVSSYQAGQISQYTATVYLGSTYDEPLSAAFLDDVYNSTRPVVWIYDNIWQLTSRNATTFQTKYGWMWSQFDTTPISHVQYKGATLTRDGVHNGGGIMSYSALDTTKATVVAKAVHDSDDSTIPWAVRSGTLTYVGENPFVYTNETDRVHIFEDLLFDALAPTTATRHRALLRLEDINPAQDGAQLRQIAEYLYAQGIPYGFGVSPVYTDPTGAQNGGVPESSNLSDRGNSVAATIKWMQSHGGTMVMHGYTHQYQTIPNPYNGVTGDDFEFYRVTENPDHSLNYLGPVAEDSQLWVASRLFGSAREFQRAGIAQARIFEFPHYAGSALDYQTVAMAFPARWERGMYYGGYLTGGQIDYSHVIGEGFPYLVRDVYGSIVLPENCGAYAPEAFYGFRPHGVADILAAADAQMVVRDGVAGFYYHPFEGLEPLKQIVAGFKARGLTFISPTQYAGI
jgi:uncharacterized protein YdaL